MLVEFIRDRVGVNVDLCSVYLLFLCTNLSSYIILHIYRLGCSFLLDIRVVCISVQVQVISVHIMYIRAALCMYGHLFFSVRSWTSKKKQTY